MDLGSRVRKPILQGLRDTTTLDSVLANQLIFNSSSPHRCVTQSRITTPAIHVDHVHCTLRPSLLCQGTAAWVVGTLSTSEATYLTVGVDSFAAAQQ
jgi:hypothetical protein